MTSVQTGISRPKKTRSLTATGCPKKLRSYVQWSQGFHSHLASPRSERQHRAWGLRPRIDIAGVAQPTVWATAVIETPCNRVMPNLGGRAGNCNHEICRPLRGLRQSFSPAIPGLAPLGFMLSRAPRATDLVASQMKTPREARCGLASRGVSYDGAAINFLLLPEQKTRDSAHYDFLTNVTRTG
jgi:hypothetical protein